MCREKKIKKTGVPGTNRQTLEERVLEREEKSTKSLGTDHIDISLGLLHSGRVEKYLWRRAGKITPETGD